MPEANRCLYCFDAPCTGACPTHIDVPGFIKKIANGNLSGSVAQHPRHQPAGRQLCSCLPGGGLCKALVFTLQRAADPDRAPAALRHGLAPRERRSLPFTPAPDTGLSVALIGAGPASLACAAELRRRGIRANLYDARPLPGGLNTYGVAEYKLPLVESLREIEMLSQLGVEFQFENMIDAQVLADLERTHDAIFLGIGLGAIHQLGVPGEQLPGVTNALDLIAGYKSGKLTRVPQRVVVVGAGNTAIDAAIASVRLGATDVHIVYRRGEELMSAFTFEYEHARLEGVKFLWHVQPTRILGRDAVEQVELIQLAATANGSIIPQPGTEFSLAADLVVLAIGQGTQGSLLEALAAGSQKLQLERGRIVIDRATGQTSHPKFFSGGDCTNGGREVVDAVADGKRAGIGIAAWLEAKLARA